MRRRSRRTKWIYANQNYILQTGAVNAQQWLYEDMVPAGVVSYLCQNRMSVVRILLWLKIAIENPVASGVAYGPNMLVFSVYRNVVDEVSGGLSQNKPDPFAPPTVPASIASWETADPGAQDVMWSHAMFPGMQGNSNEGAQWLNAAPTPITSATLNQMTQWDNTVSVFGRPDVDIKVRRRLRGGDGISFACQSSWANNTPAANLIVCLAWRVLAST